MSLRLSFHLSPSIFLALIITVLFSGNTIAGKPAPNFSLPTLDGGTVELAKHKGEVVYIDFWATWCPPCRKSFPWMEEMHKKYEDLGLKIIAISLDGKRAPVELFLKSMPASFTIAHDPQGKSADTYKLKGMPTSYLIDRDGNIQSSHTGFRESDKQKLEKHMKKLLTQ